MAETYGSVVQGSHDSFDLTGGKAKLTYTITNNPKSVVVTYTLGFVLTASRVIPPKTGVSTSVNVSGNANGNTGSGTLSFSLTNQGNSSKKVVSTKSVTLVSSKTAEYIKGTSARTFAIGFSAKMSYGSTSKTSSGSLTVSVPALASYPVTYDANGGASAPASQTKYLDVALTLKNDKPSLSGYTFKGWSTSQERANHKDSNQQPDQIDYASGGSYTGNAALVLYAAWEKDYIKPTITNVKLERCKADGSLDDEGTYARLLFDWAIDTTKHAGNTVGSLTVTVGTITEELSVTGTSGSYGSDNSVIIGNGSFNTDTQYPATITLADTCVEADPTSWTGTLGLAYFPLDISANGDSVALAMPAPDNTHGIYFGDTVYLKNHSGTMLPIIDFFYPVGSYYETSDTTFDPNTTWGGTWRLETEGQVHISAGTNYTVDGALTDKTDGGSEFIQEHAHIFTNPTYTTAGAGSHSHAPGVANRVFVTSTSGVEFTRHSRKQGTGAEVTYLVKSTQSMGYSSVTDTEANHSHTVNLNSNGVVGVVSGETTGNAGNMQPYIIVNRWHRTA